MMGSVMGIFTLMTPVLIHLVVRNYVTRLEYDPAADRYTASTITLLLRTRRVRPLTDYRPLHHQLHHTDTADTAGTTID